MICEVRDIEKHRAFWAKLAKEHNWYIEPFFVIAWIDNTGNIVDSVSYTGLDRDMIVRA